MGELTPSRMFPKSNVASQVSKTDRNLKHWFTSNSNHDNDYSATEIQNDHSDNSKRRRESVSSPLTRKRTLIEYLVDIPNTDNHSSVAPGHAIALAMKGNKVDDEKKTWICQI